MALVNRFSNKNQIRVPIGSTSNTDRSIGFNDRVPLQLSAIRNANAVAKPSENDRIFTPFDSLRQNILNQKTEGREDAPKNKFSNVRQLPTHTVNSVEKAKQENYYYYDDIAMHNEASSHFSLYCMKYFGIVLILVL